MEKLPLNDPAMLMSAINCLLRDNVFQTLDEICKHFSVKKDELLQRMAEAGFEYSEELRKFW